MVDTIYTSQTPVVQNDFDGQTHGWGMEFTVSADATCTGGRAWVPTAGRPTTFFWQLWRIGVPNVLLAESDLNAAGHGSPTSGTWMSFTSALFTTPGNVSLDDAEDYVVDVFFQGGNGVYTDDGSETFPVGSGGLVSSTTGRFNNLLAQNVMPATSYAAYFFADVSVEVTGSGTTASAGNAPGTGVANSPTAGVSPSAGGSAGTGAAQTPAVGSTPSAGAAVGTGAAETASAGVAPSGATATGTGVAGDAQAQTAVIGAAGVALGVGVASNAAVNTSGTASAGVASGTGAALQPSTSQEGDVHLYKFGPCEPWTPTWPRGDCYVLDLVGAPEVTGVAVQAASEILYQLTAQRFGLCRVKLRPCRQSCSQTFPWHQWWQYGTYPQPYWWAGTWYNLACGSCPNDSCSCVHLEETTLPGPVYDVVEVKVDGVALVKNVDYRIDDYRKLVRLGGQLWPFCQNMNLADTEVDTWSVTVDYGEVVPALGGLAVGELASELVKYLLCLDCQLPQGTVDVSRQGISMTIANIGELFNTGFINLRMCDLFIKTANPNHAQARPAVYDLDGPQHRATGTTP